MASNLEGNGVELAPKASKAAKRSVFQSGTNVLTVRNVSVLGAFVRLGVISSVAVLPWLDSGDPCELSFSSRVVVGHPPWFSAFAEVSAGVFNVEGSPTTFPC